MNGYPPPVEQLLKRGNIEWGSPWVDYRALGIGPEHIPDLLRILKDLSLHRAATEGPEVWAPVHAWRALAQLGAVDAAQPFLDTLAALEAGDGDNFMREEAPEFFRQLGAGPLPVLTAFLADKGNPLYARWGAANSLQKLAEDSPTTRAAVVEALVTTLRQATDNDPALNAGLIASLLDLKAAETIDDIRAAYAKNAVEEMVVGSLAEVEYDLGLRDSPPPRDPGRWLKGRFAPPAKPGADHAAAKAKAQLRVAATLSASRSSILDLPL
jgi:hypothetical protein